MSTRRWRSGCGVLVLLAAGIVAASPRPGEREGEAVRFVEQPTGTPRTALDPVLLAVAYSPDAVTIFDEDTPLEVLQSVRPHVLVKGGDYRLDQVVGREFMEATGGRVALVPLTPEKSTTALVERIRAGGKTS